MTDTRSECAQCRDWGRYERHEDHWPPHLPADTDKGKVGQYHEPKGDEQ